MSKRQERLDRIRAVEREYLAAELATRSLQDALRRNPVLLTPGLKQADVHGLADNLQATYVMRLYAEFEAGLREVWASACKKKSTPGAEVLMNSLAGRFSISDEHRDNAHVVRKYRNAIVHEGTEAADSVTLELARKHLCTFFSWLPLAW